MSNIKLVEFANHIFISKVKNHAYLKEEILKEISKMGRFSVETDDSKLYNTDFFTPSQYDRPYFSVIRHALENHNNELFNFLKSSANGIQIDRCWFQQYKKDCYHGRHAHGKCNFSNVYYVDLNKETPKTTFTVLGQQFEVEVEEGDIITFPAYLEHESLPNKTEYTKTVISFNSNIS
jgi:hypothetical protein